MTIRELLVTLIKIGDDLDKTANVELVLREPEGDSVTHKKVVPITRISYTRDTIIIENSDFIKAVWELNI